MGHIIAGRFDDQEKAENLAQALEEAGIDKDKVSVFYVAPDGQHHVLPLGGDKGSSPGASESGKGAWMGAGAGAVAGAAVGSVGGPVGVGIGAGVGAYTGSLAGAVSKTRDEPESDPEAVKSQAQLTDRKSGPHVAAEVNGAHRDKVIGLIRDHGGKEVEEADGSIEDSEWLDFDPTKPVKLVSGQ
ncbi:hypothetical protein [Marinobacter salicampi]|uniref:hypothetical protein n=1 Tax=Marinobacter salicampi TaxID=435907 RepID=UPI00140C0500|nr:hypothetical protein [Marinobacter salicampi]